MSSDLTFCFYNEGYALALSHGLAGFIQLWRKARGMGLPYAAQRLLMRPHSLFFINTFIIFELNLRNWMHDQNSEPYIRWATPEDLDLLTTRGHDPSLLRHRFERGARACIMERAGQLIGHAWLDPNDYTKDGCLLFMSSPEDVWSIDGWVAPEYRGQHLYNRIKGAAASECARRGYSRMLSCVDILNRNSIRTQHSMGSKSIGRVFIVRFLGFTLIGYRRSIRLGRWSNRRPLQLSLHSFDREPH